MEHLDIDTSDKPLLRVPLYEHTAIAQYKYEGFHDYLRARGTTTDALVARFVRPQNEDDLRKSLTLLQGFCWFGLLDSFFRHLQVSLVVDDFISIESNGNKYITTQYLPTLARAAALIRAKACVQKHNAQGHFITEHSISTAPTAVLVLCTKLDSFTKELGQPLKHDIDLAVKFIRRIEKTLSAQRPLMLYQDLDYQLLLSIAVLVETLQWLVFEYFKQAPSPPLTIDPTALTVFCLQSRWCMNRIAGIDARAPSVAVMAIALDSHDNRIHGLDPTPFITSTDPFARGGDTKARDELITICYGERSFEGNQQCGGEGCIHSKSAFDLVLPVHRCKDEANCANIEFDPAVLADIYRQDSFPLVSFNREGDHLLAQPIKHEEGMEYVALSHVWAHGLGNPNRNSLPACQFAFLEGLVRQISPTAVLWEDSVCVPVDAHFKDVRQLAIRKMADIYRNASYTIVLDKFVEQSSRKHIEIGFQLLWSEWSARLWTLQEAVLPGEDKLMVCVQGTLVPWKRIANSSREVRTENDSWLKRRMAQANIDPKTMIGLTTFERDLVADATSDDQRCWRMCPVAQISNPMERTVNLFLEATLDVADAQSPNCLMDLYSMLKRRCVSVPTDEFICIAQLLNLDMGSFATIPSSMDEIVRRVAITENIIFLAGERVSKPGFRWCPTSLLSSAAYVSHYYTKPAILTENGLQIVKHGWVFDGTIDIEVGVWRTIEVDGRGQVRFKISAANMRDLSASALRPLNAPALILISSLEIVKGEGASTKPGALVNRIQPSPGIDGNAIYAEFVSVVDLWFTDVEGEEKSKYPTVDAPLRVPGEYKTEMQWILS